MKAGGTPGPWRVEPEPFVGASVGFDVMAETEEEPVCVAADVRTEADAFLMAAAPDLLVALRALVKEAVWNEDDCSVSFKEFNAIHARAEAAIAKAEGRAAADAADPRPAHVRCVFSWELTCAGPSITYETVAGPIALCEHHDARRKTEASR